MFDMTPFLNMIFTLFIMLIVGYVSGKLGIIDGVASKNLSKLIIHVGQPAMIIYNLVKMEYSAQNLGIGFITLAFGLGFHVFLAVLAYFAFLRYRDIDARKISEFAAIFGNVGFIGIPILESVFGEIGAFQGAFFNVSFQLLLWTWGIVILARKRNDIKITPKKVILNFGTVPSAFGIALFLMKGIKGFFIPQPIMLSLSFIAALCTPISMLIIGALIASRSLKPMLCSGKIYYLCVMKLLVLPIVICGLMRLLGCDAEWILFAAVVASMPSATTVTMLAELHDISPVYSAQAVGATSLFSVATMPCVVWIAQWLISL